MPTVINGEGARELLELELSKVDKNKLDESCKIISENMEEIRKVIF